MTIQPRSYECCANDWLSVSVYGREREYNNDGHYGDRMPRFGDSIYSYGQHFELARVLFDGKGRNRRARAILLNGDRESVTTTKHQWVVRNTVGLAGLPSTIIPFSAIAAAGIDISSIKIVDSTPDRTLVTEKRRLWPEGLTRRANMPIMKYIPVPLEERLKKLAELNDEARTRFIHQLDYEWRWDENRRKMEEYEGFGVIPWTVHTLETAPSYRIPEKQWTKVGTHPPYYTQGRGRRNSAWENRVEPDEDGYYTHVTSRHILGESLIECDVAAPARVKCKSCDGKGWVNRRDDEFPNLIPSSHEIGFLDGVGLAVKRRVRYPVPTVLPSHTSEWNFDRYLLRSGWTTILEDDLGVLPLRREHYDCGSCRGAGKVPGTRRRRNIRFLSGFDHNESHLAYFLCEMPRMKEYDYDTVDGAYEALKPDAVVVAEAMGREVLRQGDIFAIPVTTSTAELKRNAKAIGLRNPPTHRRVTTRTGYVHESLFGGRGRPVVSVERVEIDEDERVRMRENSMLLGTNHQGTEVIHANDGTIYARGCLWHVPDGRRNDHARVKLGKQWHVIVTNTVPRRNA